MAKRRRAKRLPTVLTAGEVRDLLAVIKTKSRTSRRNRAMLDVMLGAGLRVSEVTALMPRDLDLNKGEVRVNLGKGGKDRVIPIEQHTNDSLRSWMEKRVRIGLNGHNPVFPALRTGNLGGEFGTRQTSQNVWEMVRKAARRAGIMKKCSPHTLRHTYATTMLDRGMTVAEVQMLLGHSDMTTTMIYTHADPVQLREKVQGGRRDEVTEKIAALEQQLAELKALAGGA